MSVDFYDLKLRKHVLIPENNITKAKFRTRRGHQRHALRGKTSDGRSLAKFISKAEWESLPFPEDR